MGPSSLKNCATLSLSGDCRLTFTDFLLLQRIAQEGSEAIRVLLSNDPDLKSVISKGYTWGASLLEMARGSQYFPLLKPQP